MRRYSRIGVGAPRASKSERDRGAGGAPPPMAGGAPFFGVELMAEVQHRRRLIVEASTEAEAIEKAFAQAKRELVGAWERDEELATAHMEYVDVQPAGAPDDSWEWAGGENHLAIAIHGHRFEVERSGEVWTAYGLDDGGARRSHGETWLTQAQALRACALSLGIGVGVRHSVAARAGAGSGDALSGGCLCDFAGEHRERRGDEDACGVCAAVGRQTSASLIVLVEDDDDPAERALCVPCFEALPPLARNIEVIAHYA